MTWKILRQANWIPGPNIHFTNLQPSNLELPGKTCQPKRRGRTRRTSPPHRTFQTKRRPWDQHLRFQPVIRVFFWGEGNTEIICKSCTVPAPSRERFVHIPPWEKENHRLKIDFSGDMSLPWRVYINTGKKIRYDIFRAILEHIGPFHKISMLERKLCCLLGWWPNHKF